VHLNLPLELTKQGIERETAQNKENKTAFKSHTGVSFICSCMIGSGDFGRISCFTSNFQNTDRHLL
jgi:hypothetical protein